MCARIESKSHLRRHRTAERIETTNKEEDHADVTAHARKPWQDPIDRSIYAKES
jgi:hypothetical protein